MEACSKHLRRRSILPEAITPRYPALGRSSPSPSATPPYPLLHPLRRSWRRSTTANPNPCPPAPHQALLAEVNNGRLAMIGIMAFMAEAKLPGAVPGLVGKVSRQSSVVV